MKIMFVAGNLVLAIKNSKMMTATVVLGFLIAMQIHITSSSPFHSFL